MASNKRPTGGDFEPPNVPLKQLHADAKPKPSPQLTINTPPLKSLQPIITTIPQKQVVKPAFIGILPTNPSRSPTSLEYPTPATITTPSGIIPLPSSGHPLHVAIPSQPTTQLALSTLTSLSQRFSNANLIRPLMTHPLLSSSQLISAASITSPPQMIPDAPPPPYPLSESVSEDFGCSSPSQFLHSPTSVQTSTANFDELKDKLQHGQTTTSEDVKKLRLNFTTKRKSQMTEIKRQHMILLQEKFFLEGGGNMMDYQVWKKKPNILKDQYTKQHDLDSETPAFEDLLSPRYPTQTGEKMDTENILEQEPPLDFETVPKSSVTKNDIPEPLSLLQVPPTSKSNTLQPMTPISAATSPRSLTLSSPRPILRSHSTLSVTEVSHEDIVMRARHEAEVMKAISELRKEGLWSSSRLPKVQEPQRIKTHWDYLLEEMQWLATDFANERRWKMNAAKKLCRTISRHHQEKEVVEHRAQKDELQRLRKIASTMAKEVKHFWDSIQKVVEHKHQAILEEKRRKAMDMHLNFIVDQTQKYSSWLMKGMATTPTPTDPSLTSTASREADSDDLFSPSVDNIDDSDDEETINKEESLANEKGELDYKSELQQLEREGEMSLDELLASLPSELLEERAKTDINEEERTNPSEEDGEDKMEDQNNKEKSSTRAARKRTRDVLSDDENAIESKAVKKDSIQSDDDEYIGSGLEDEEGTIEEQEQHEKETTDYEGEVDALEEESNMPIEELLRKYQSQRESATPDCDSNDDDDDEKSEEEMKQEEENEEEEDMMDVGSDEPGLESLVSGKTVQEACQTEQGLTDVAAAAQELQPKGTTLSTTEVKTKVPFLLKHSLREYQHIGLDWLVTMYEKHLNGILADEMGLGKTIQTIALLAHLACDKGNWGPHLIIVPTSVMLNWEFELKKWCPGFKILTYFGSFKERKQKRVGWSKYNAFHVCITSYNIAVQDHRSFKQKKWKYLILDEAQNIKNFKSQRWQTLLTFNSQHRLLLTGTPLQNNLMELWSLMHFLMPTVFSSHSDFKEWFSNPLTGMVEGSQDYNESIITRLHQVLRPFLLRRLKKEVEKQLPKKYEHLVLCRLSKRQRFLYEEYMSRTKTKETLVTGNYMSVINVLMQLRKVCNHPDLFEPRPVVSPLRMLGIAYTTASLILTPLSYNPFKQISFDFYNLCLGDYELTIDSFAAYRSRQLQAPRQSLIDTDSFIRGESVAELIEEDKVDKNDSLSDLSSLMSNEMQWAKSRREHLHEVNTFHCRRQPVYGRDLLQTIQGMTLLHNHTPLIDNSCQSHWLYSGYHYCNTKQFLPEDKRILCVAQPLTDILCSLEERSLRMKSILKRFVLTVPMATSPPISFHVSHPDPSDFIRDCNQKEILNNFVTSNNQIIHSADTAMCLQFPETRLIQYDCGKLQTLSNLLRRLKTDGHRVLMFTQMARMLDVLEIFLNYHGYTYLRLDGATPVTKRQVLMDRFNMDPRVFCFILSTRSGGLGVNLTGADTVIFYDSDWNPTMDAQAQDRCHRIGQTRDVHIYRLICESTVEENILKKANQKRMLGNIAIDSGAFTTEFFKQSSLKELFTVSKGALEGQRSSIVQPSQEHEKMSQKQLEELLLQAEEENDVNAAKMAREEVAADLAEFDEQYNQQQQNNSNDDYHDAETSRVVLEFAALQEQLSGIEKYMMRFLETENAEVAAQQLKQTEDDIQQAKKDWELSHLQQLREQEEKMAREEEEKEEAMCLTYDRPEMINKVIIEDETGEEMNVWLPPTPPTDDINNFYIDYTLEMSYDTTTVMNPDQLLSAAIHCEDDSDVFGLYKPPHENFTEPMKKSQNVPTKLKREHMPIPQSLFWRRYTPDILTTRIRKLSPQTKKVKGKAEQFTPLLEAQDGPEWLSTEDWILIKGLTATLEFPLSLNCTVPAQTPNWSILADLVSSYSKTKRSPLQCKDHLVGVVIPREEQITRTEETDPKKHKSRDVPQMKKHKNRREQKTRTMVLHDKCKEGTKQFGSCFHWIYMSSEKRRLQNKQSSNSSITRTSMHSELLQKEYDVSMDTVRSPMYLAQNRAERLQSEIPRAHQLHSHQQAPPYAHLSQMSRQLSANLKNTTGVSLTGTSTWPNPPITSQRVHSTSVPTTVSSATTIAATTETPTLPPSTPVMPVTVKPIQSTPSAISSLPSIVGITTATTTVSTIVSTHSITTPTVSSAISNAAAAAAAAAVAKTYSAGVDINKGILLNHRLTQQQLLLLRQTAIQHQQQLQKQQQQAAAAAAAATLTTPTTQNIQLQRHQIVTTTQAQPIQLTSSTQVGQTTPSIQTQQTLAKIQIPGIEQLRPTIALSNQRVQGALVRAAGLPARSMQTEEVLALLRQQQALRMAMQTQTAKLAQQHQQQQLSQTQQQQTTTQTTGLSEAIAAAALAAAAVQQQQQQASKQQQVSKQQPSIVTPAESVKTPEQLSLIEANQLKVELIERSQTPKQK